MPSAKQLKQKAEAKKKAFEAKPHECLQSSSWSLLSSITSEAEDNIALRSSVADLVSAIATKKYTSSEVSTVLIKRAHELGRKGVNALTDELYDAALVKAKEVDAKVSASSSSQEAGRPLLFGVPISIKDHVDVEGTDSTTGAAVRCFAPKEKDALIVELLRDAGALIYCKTNVPQCLMLPESTNRVFGTTNNPWNATRCCGGSSGGEAALIALRGSLLGVGTDIAGSCRIPAHFCGIVGFKPTPSRTSEHGLSMPYVGNKIGMKAIKLTAGPMGLFVDDLTLILRTWWVEKMWKKDPYVVPLPFDMDMYQNGPRITNVNETTTQADGDGDKTTGKKRKIRLGYFTTDGWFQPCRAGIRAVNEAKAALLEGNGEDEYEFVEIKQLPKDGWEAARLFYNIVGADGGMHGYVKGLEGEPLIPLYWKLYLAASLPDFLRPLANGVFYLLGEERLRFITSGLRRHGLSTREYWQYSVDLQTYQEAWVAMMEDLGLDGFLCPGPALPAFPHGLSQELDSACSYTFFVNLLHFPAGLMPITRVQDDEQIYPLEDIPSIQRDSIAKAAGRCMAKSEGLPVGVHVVTKPFQDELCLHIMKRLEDRIEFTKKHIPELAKRNVFGR